jgi:hypothetical protein
MGESEVAKDIAPVPNGEYRYSLGGRIYRVDDSIVTHTETKMLALPQTCRLSGMGVFAKVAEPLANP